MAPTARLGRETLSLPVANGIIAGSPSARALRCGEWLDVRRLFDPGETTLRIEAEGYAPFVHEVSLVAGETTEVDVVLTTRR